MKLTLDQATAMADHLARGLWSQAAEELRRAVTKARTESRPSIEAKFTPKDYTPQQKVKLDAFAASQRSRFHRTL